MRLALLAFCLASPAAAWDFSPTPVCTLFHDTGTGRIEVTHDPRQAEPYAVEVTNTTPWPGGPVFALRFDGPRALTITTDRHSLSSGGTALTVTDRGFGNVLNGLEFNTTATALLGDIALPFPLDGAAPHVQAFRACTDAPLT